MEYILIADDNKDITDILEKYVKKEGYGAVVATDGFRRKSCFTHIIRRPYCWM